MRMTEAVRMGQRGSRMPEGALATGAGAELCMVGAGNYTPHGVAENRPDPCAAGGALIC